MIRSVIYGGNDMNKIKLILGASILLLVSAQANATPVNYDELISGDLPDGLPINQLTNVGTFDIGINTVSGSTTGAFSGDISDQFLFNIAEGHQLDSATIYFYVTGLSSMAFQLAKINDINVPTQFYNEHTVVSLTEDPTTSSALAFSAVMPETAGTFRVNSPGSFGSISDNVYLNYTWAFEVSQVPAPLSVTIDIKPGSDPNSVNPRSKGVIPVAVLGSGEFYAPLVDFLTVEFGPGKASPVHDGHVEDVNGDGFDDMVFHFKTQDTGIVCGDTDASLTGSTFANPDSVDIEGADSINIVKCP